MYTVHTHIDTHQNLHIPLTSASFLPTTPKAVVNICIMRLSSSNPHRLASTVNETCPDGTPPSESCATGENSM